MTKPEFAPKGPEDYQKWLETDAQIMLDLGNVSLLSAGASLAVTVGKLNEILNKYK